MHHANLVADLASVLGVAAVTSVIARLVNQPTILGYLLAGLIVGPYIPFPIFADQSRIEAMAELGVVLVMFAVGLEFRIAKLMRVLPVSGLSGVLQISFLMWCGFSLGLALGWSRVEATFLGAAIAISSTMVVSKVYDQTKVAADVRDHVFGILILQDVAAIALMAATTAVARGGGLSTSELLVTLGRLAAVLVGLLTVGLLVVPRLVRRVTALDSPEILSVFSIGLCFVLAELAEVLGYSVALGAFIAGILVAESGKGAKVEHTVQPVRDAFAAIFFVSIGMTVDPVQELATLPVALLVFAVVVTAQFAIVSVAGVLSGTGLRRSIVAGLSLGQIGEFAFILAGIGIGAGVVRPSLQPILVTVAVLTAFTTPILVRAADRVVETVDRRMPERLQHLLGLYEAWLERFRATSGEATARPMRRALRVVAFDAVALVAIVAATLSFGGEASAALERACAIPRAVAAPLPALAALAVSLPFALALFRNARRLIDGIVAAAFPADPDATPGARAAANTLRIVVRLVVLLAVGLPSSAIIRPLAGGAWASLVLALLVIGSAFLVWRSAGAIENEYRSGAERIAVVLARQTARDEPSRVSLPTILPGLDGASSVPIGPDAYAIGKTLAQLNLRAKTGAMVVAIRRDDANVLLPTGHELLAAGDVLAIVGSEEAIASARALVRDGSGDEATAARSEPTREVEPA